MALTGIAIYKLLPQTNCKECGHPTCLAFAMKLAARQAELSDCPYVSEEAKAQLDSASAPPIRLVSVGPEERKVEVGNETVVYRHEKTFVRQPGFFYRVSDVMGEAEYKQRIEEMAAYEIERVGQKLCPDGVAIESSSGSAEVFAARVKTAVEAGLAVILIASDPAVMKAGVEAGGAARPLVCPAGDDHWEPILQVAKEHSVPLVVRPADGDLEALAAQTEAAKGQGVEDLVLDPRERGWMGSLAALTRLRRAAIKKNFRALGYPVIVFPGEGADSLEKETMLAAQFIGRYAGFIVFDHFDRASLYSLLTLRQNIYTDPQKPIQVSPGIYEIGDPKPSSPLLVTTNFSLTYFSVAGEVEGSGKPAWLLVVDSEGMSVLTAWAAGKFDAERIARAVNSTGIADKIDHKSIVLPGFVASISGELEEELPGWKILVGPRESIGIPSYLSHLSSQG